VLFLLTLSSNASEVLNFSNVTQAYGLGEYEGSAGDIHGPGAIFSDLNGDGYPDLYVVNGGSNPTGSYPNQLYISVNNGTSFARVEMDGGAGDTKPSIGAIAGDYDNDGDIDIFVGNYNADNVLLQNQLTETGIFSFIDVTAQTDPTASTNDNQYGLARAYQNDPNFGNILLDNTLTAAWADVDRDGDLDLYVGNHDAWCLMGTPESPYNVPGQRDIFYLNNGNGTFTEMTDATGLTGFESVDGQAVTQNQSYSSANAVQFADFNNDGWPDLLVTNKVGGIDDRNMLYINKGMNFDGEWLGYENVSYRFANTFGHNSGAAMGVDVADIDNDGDLDIYFADVSRNAIDAPGENDLWINQLTETGELGFLYSSSIPGVFSWGVQWQDFNLDGKQDLYVASHRDFSDQLYIAESNSWTNHAVEAGTDQSLNSRTAISADVNRDGWPDVFVANMGGSTLYLNNSKAAFPDNNYLMLNLTGDPSLPGRLKSSKDAIGARVTVTADLNADGIISDDESMTREVVSGSSSAASSASLELEFGLGKASVSMVEVQWPSGRNMVFKAGVNQVVSVSEIDANASMLKNGAFSLSLTDWQLRQADGRQVSAVVSPSSNPNLTISLDAPSALSTDVALTQVGLAVQKNRTYKLRFSAKATQDTVLFTRLAQNYSPWGDLGLVKVFSLTSQWQNYEVQFTASHSDLNAKISFLLGLTNADKVFLDNVDLTLLPAASLTTSLIVNGGFESNNDNWQTLFLFGATGQTTNQNQAQHSGGFAQATSVTNSGSAVWHVQTFQQNISIIKDQAYRLSFAVKASTDISVLAQLTESNGSVNLGLYKTLDVSEQWQFYEFEFIATALNVNARLSFLLGGQPIHEFLLDSVRLEKVIPDRAPAVSAAPILANGNFEQGLLNWVVQSSPAANIEWLVSSEDTEGHGPAMLADISEGGSAAWEAQLIWKPVTVIRGLKYRLTFDAKSDAQQNVTLAIGEDNMPWTNLGIRKSVALSQDWRTYEFDFTANATAQTARLALQMGGNPKGKIWIDNVGAAASCTYFQDN
jgi:hypothetical protein